MWVPIVPLIKIPLSSIGNQTCPRCLLLLTWKTWFAGELLVGPSRVLFMDEISTGLDSSTTHQIIKYLRHSTCALDGTTVISLLQPAPETYELFDDIILLSEGQIVYQGPRHAALNFFAFMGFNCPERKNVADFLQEVSIRSGYMIFCSFMVSNFV